MSNYTIEQINIGDEIYYEDKFRSNRYPNWKVVGKLDQSLLIIEIIKPGSSEQRVIDIMDVEKLEILTKKTEDADS
jgi:hypothetical protein